MGKHNPIFYRIWLNAVHGTKKTRRFVILARWARCVNVTCVILTLRHSNTGHWINNWRLARWWRCTFVRTTSTRKAYVGRCQRRDAGEGVAIARANTVTCTRTVKEIIIRDIESSRRLAIWWSSADQRDAKFSRSNRKKELGIHRGCTAKYNIIE